ncbi:MAG: AMP-binding protein [Verrucomicrobiota bacterium]
MPHQTGYFNFSADVFDRWATEQPAATALWWVSGDRTRELRFTFAELSDLSRRASRAFQESGIHPGDPVMVMLPRVPEWWISMLGLTRFGAVPVPCTPQLTSHDLDYRLEAGNIRAVITDSEGASKLPGFSGIGWQTDAPVAGWRHLDDALLQPAPEYSAPATQASAPGIIYFTSATTGSPKMVLHTQASYGLGHEVTGKLWLDLRPEDVHWNTADLGWAKAAWSSFFGPWHCGACLFVWDARGKFSANHMLDILETYPITSLCAPPTALRMMVREDLGRRAFPRLRHCVTAGEPLNPSVFHAWKAATGLSVYEGYGQSETVILIGNFKSLGFPVVPGSMGRATPGYDVCLLDDHLNPVPDGTEGEIAVRLREKPVGIFKEYWKCREQDAPHFCGEWYLTGDRATRDADGYFWFIGRKDDVIKSSGYRIGPFEVESALIAHPSVLDVAVIGKPDEVRGQIVKAFVVLRHGHGPTDETREILQAHCKHLVAPYKYPREIEFVAELPKTVSGKTRRFELRQQQAMTTTETRTEA